MAATSKHLELEIRRLQDENARLRKALRINGRHARRIQRAADTALLLGQWHCAHLDTGRRACMAQGLSQRQWEAAITLLRMVRVVDQAGRWLVHNLTVIADAIDRAQDRAAMTPEAFFARGPRHLQG